MRNSNRTEERRQEQRAREKHKKEEAGSARRTCPGPPERAAAGIRRDPAEIDAPPPPTAPTAAGLGAAPSRSSKCSGEAPQEEAEANTSTTVRTGGSRQGKGGDKGGFFLGLGVVFSFTEQGKR